MKQLIKVFVDGPTKARLKERAGRESLSSFVSGLIDSYFEEYSGLTEAQVAEMEERMPKIGDTVTIKTPPRFVSTRPAPKARFDLSKILP